MNYIGVNGVPTPSTEAVLSVMDHGFMYGMGLFETFRTYGGQPFLLERHLDRLRNGCRSLGIRYPQQLDQLGLEIKELLHLNHLQDGYIRLTVSAGEGPLGLPSEDYETPTIIIYVKALPSMDPQLYQKGKALWRLKTPRNTPEGEIRLKSLHYMNNMLAKRELREYTQQTAGDFEGLQLTAEGFLAEGIVSNLCFVQDGRLYTPAVGTGILPGITRAFILELAGQLGIAIEEGYYEWDRLKQADELFVTNSIQEAVPVTRLYEPGGSSYMVGSGRIGPITGMLLEQYRQKAGK
ncbi:aminotransferase class IV [Paenibacillus aceti]|uniref:4-amino-4-deoxychorismate lyase n=1 Tax=Paenibacillus aceti TaxID=1820010 RepID=A0ABQ1W3Q8_9BACL|nr:aminotransferase class IV [Paenibacillus aceti]GGG10492.1 4-amino-4-deoxychorismate lyase [Paenibacillus aceti]